MTRMRWLIGGQDGRAGRAGRTAPGATRTGKLRQTVLRGGSRGGRARRDRSRATVNSASIAGQAASSSANSAGWTSIRARSPWWRTRRSPVTPRRRRYASPSSTWRSRSSVISRPYWTRLERQGAAGASQSGSPSSSAAARIMALVQPSSASGERTCRSPAAQKPGAVLAQVVGVGAIDDEVEAAAAGDFTQPGPELGLAEVAAIGRDWPGSSDRPSPRCPRRGAAFRTGGRCPPPTGTALRDRTRCGRSRQGTARGRGPGGRPLPGAPSRPHRNSRAGPGRGWRDGREEQGRSDTAET